MGKQINCNICLTKGDTIPMKPMDGYFVCPVCGNESWPDREGMFVDRWKKEQRQQSQYISLSQQPGVKIKGGGDPSGKSPDIGKKQSTQKIYNQMFKQT